MDELEIRCTYRIKPLIYGFIEMSYLDVFSHGHNVVFNEYYKERNP